MINKPQINEDLNLTKKEDITEGVKVSNINKDSLGVKETKSMIENTLNTFNKDVHGNHARKVLKIFFCI